MAEGISGVVVKLRGDLKENQKWVVFSILEDKRPVCVPRVATCNLFGKACTLLTRPCFPIQTEVRGPIPLSASIAFVNDSKWSGQLAWAILGVRPLNTGIGLTSKLIPHPYFISSLL